MALPVVKIPVVFIGKNSTNKRLTKGIIKLYLKIILVEKAAYNIDIINIPIIKKPIKPKSDSISK